MHRLLKPDVSAAQRKHSSWCGTSTHLHPEGKMSPSPHSIQRQSYQIHFLRKCQNRVHSNQTANLLKFLFPHLNILCFYFICVTSVPAIRPLPHQSPLCSPFSWLRSLLCSSHLASLVSSGSPVYSPQQREAQKLTSWLLFRRKYLKHKYL